MHTTSKFIHLLMGTWLLPHLGYCQCCCELWDAFFFLSCCCCPVAQSCPTFSDSMDCSTLGFPILHHLSELAETQVHRVFDAIQSSLPLSSPSPLAFNLSQRQGLF